MQVSEGTADDLPQILQSWDWRDPARSTGEAPVEIAAATSPPSSSVLVGKINGDVVAGAAVAFDGRRGWICGVWVHQTFRRQGLGRAIVSEAEAWLRQRGAMSIHLQVRFTNLAMIGFYDKLGYRFQDMVVLGKALAASG